MDHFEYFSIHPITTKHGLIQFHSKDEKQIKVTLLGLDPRMTDTTIKASFSRFGELKTLLRHTFKFKRKEYLNGNISLYFTKLTHQLPDRMNQNPTGKHETIFKIQFNPKINEELPELESSDKEEEENMEEVEKEQQKNLQHQ